jgi:hypothetical protein
MTVKNEAINKIIIMWTSFMSFFDCKQTSNKNNVMDEIPQIEDKIKALYLYIENNQSDTEGDSWYYVHNPTIVSHLNDFTKEECQKLVSVIWNWEEEIIVDLADPFLDTSNPNLDGYYLYCKIFLAISNIENEEYLLNNIHLAICISEGSQPISFYHDLEHKVTRVSEELKQNHKYSIEQIRLKIITEKNLPPTVLR